MPEKPTPFSLEINADDKAYINDIVRSVIEQALTGTKMGDIRIPERGPGTSAVLDASLGAFVTLKKQGNLRGCIGTVEGVGPLYATVANMAYAAAFRDPRFQPVQSAEYPALSMDISIMGPITPCPDPGLIEIGRHGLILRQGGRSGLLLPQVPVEWNWDVPTFLEQLCRKAGLPPGTWKDNSAQLLWFEAVHFDLPA